MGTSANDQPVNLIINIASVYHESGYPARPHMYDDEFDPLLNAARTYGIVQEFARKQGIIGGVIQNRPVFRMMQQKGRFAQSRIIPVSRIFLIKCFYSRNKL